MTIDTNQHNTTKIIDGCQEIIKILADKKNSCSPKCSYAIWAEIEKEEMEFPASATLWQGEFT